MEKNSSGLSSFSKDLQTQRYSWSLLSYGVKAILNAISYGKNSL